MTRKNRDEEREDENESTSQSEDPGGYFFDNTVNEVPITVKDRDGKVNKYMAKEMDGDDFESWQTEQAQRMAFDGNGDPIGLKNYKSYRASLICRCVWDLETGELVTKKVVGRWKAFIQQSTFLLCRDMNGMNLTKPESSKPKKD